VYRVDKNIAEQYIVTCVIQYHKSFVSGTILIFKNTLEGFGFFQNP
jgi:hypothetical protein